MKTKSDTQHDTDHDTDMTAQTQPDTPPKPAPSQKKSGNSQTTQSPKNSQNSARTKTSCPQRDNSRKGKTKKDKNNRYYTIFYITSFVILTVVGFLGMSFFASHIFSAPIFSVLTLILITAMFVVRSIQSYRRQKTNSRFAKIFCLVYFNILALSHALRFVVPYRPWTFVLLLSFAAAFTLLLAAAFQYAKGTKINEMSSFDSTLVLVPLLVILMNTLSQEYVDENLIWLPSLCIGLILAAVSIFVFIKFFRNIEYFNEHKKGRIAAIIILMLFASVMVSASAVTTINYAFDRNPTPVVTTVLDKDVRNGARSPTRFMLTVTLNGAEKDIEVPAETYHSTQIGDAVEIQLYGGTLGYAYYIYE